LAFNDFVAGPPVSVIHFHGAQDKKVLYNGLPNWGFFGVEHGIRVWATRNGCKSAPTVIRDDPNTLVRRWEAPNGTGDVILYKLKNHGHSMPTPPICNLPEIAWEFFKNHPRSNVKTPWPEESQSSTEPFAVGPYLGQTPPGSTARVFAPGLICDMRPHQWEACGSFSADGNTFCFKRRGYDFITENTDQGWTTPERIQSIPFMSGACCLSPDANSIYFMYKYDPSKHYHPFRCQRTSDGWSEPQELGSTFNYSGEYAGFSLAANNSIYLFRSKPRGGGSGGGIFYVPYVNNTWPRLIKLPQVGTYPGIAPDESFMVFTAIRQGGQGATDLYLTLRRPDGTWTEARNMGPKINSRYYEFGARISSDKKYMFFTRANGWFENPHRDTSDIYWVELMEYLPESYR